MIKNIIILFFGFLLGYYIFGHSNCNFDLKNVKYDTIKSTIDTEYIKKDTIIYKKGKEIYHDTTIFVDIPTDRIIDTAAILAQFYAINVFKDTIHLQDSLGSISVVDSISENKIKGRIWSANIKQTIITKETILREKPKSHIYAGVGMNGFANSVEGSLLLQNKKGKILQLGVVKDLNNNATIAKVGVIWKIK